VCVVVVVVVGLIHFVNILWFECLILFLKICCVILVCLFYSSSPESDTFRARTRSVSVHLPVPTQSDLFSFQPSYLLATVPLEVFPLVVDSYCVALPIIST